MTGYWEPLGHISIERLEDIIRLLCMRLWSMKGESGLDVDAPRNHTIPHCSDRIDGIA